jgi:uncharacterized phiE125 gp8 family phage protein
MRIPVSTVTGPSVEPVTLAEIKTHLRGISHTDHDDLLNSLIQSAREYVETATNRALVQRTLAAYFKDWPDNDTFYLPYAPLQSVSTIKYTDTDGTVTTFSSDDYEVETNLTPGMVLLGYEKTWPTATLHNDEYPIEVTYVCGYEPDSSSPVSYTANIPENLKTAIKFHVEMMYDKPPADYVGTLEKAIDSLLIGYKVWGF